MPEIINYKGMWEPVNMLDSAQLDEKFRWSSTTDSVGKKVTLISFPRNSIIRIKFSTRLLPVIEVPDEILYLFGVLV